MNPQTLLGFLIAILVANTAAAAPPKIPIILDTDIGSDLDDAFALALVLASPELDLRAVTTVSGDAYTRACLVCRFLEAAGRSQVPVASGQPPLQAPDRTKQLSYGLQQGHSKRPERESAVQLLYREFKARPGQLTLLALGPLTNVAELLTQYPECKPWIPRIVFMGGAVRVGYNGKPPVEAEWNLRSDVKASETVFNAGIPLVVAPLDATAQLRLVPPRRQRVVQADTPLARQLRVLAQLADQPEVVLYDPVAVVLCFDERFCRMESLRLEVNSQGIMRVVPGEPNARVATTIRREEFLAWYVERLAPVPPAARPLQSPL
jgi:purine nucleosidase